jgi:antitoxin CptB
MDEPLLDARSLSRLRWRCRRGMLENDLLIERFFRRHEATITARQGAALAALMELPDNELLDLLLARAEPRDTLDTPDVHEVLGRLRQPAAAAPAPELRKAPR